MSPAFPPEAGVDTRWLPLFPPGGPSWQDLADPAVLADYVQLALHWPRGVKAHHAFPGGHPAPRHGLDWLFAPPGGALGGTPAVPPAEQPDLRIAIPRLLWQAILEKAGTGFATSAPSKPAAWHELAACPAPTDAGATWDERLYAGGVVVEPPSPTLAHLHAMSPRVAWYPDGGAWRVHPLLLAMLPHWTAGRPPQLHRGPGFLLECIVEGFHDLVGPRPPTDRDCAVFWALYPMQVLVPSRGRPSHRVIFQGQRHYPPYCYELGFWLLHPYARLVLPILHQLAEWMRYLDHDGRDPLLALLDELGRLPEGNATANQTTKPTLTDRRLLNRVDKLARELALPIIEGKRKGWFADGKLRSALLELGLGPEGRRFDRSWLLHTDKTHASRKSNRHSRSLGQGLAHAFSLGKSGAAKPGIASTQLLQCVWDRWTS